MENSNNSGKKTVLWVFAGILILLGLFLLLIGYSWTGFMMLIGSLIVMPIPPLEKLWSKVKNNFLIRIIVVIVWFFLAIVVLFSDGSSSSSSSYQGGSDPAEEPVEDIEVTIKNALLGNEWSYDPDDVVLNIYYTFNDDWTWSAWGEGGADFGGTYEIIGDKIICTSGDYVYEFVYKDKKHIINDEGLELTAHRANG